MIFDGGSAPYFGNRTESVLAVSANPRVLAEMKKDLSRRFEVNIAAPGEPAEAAIKACAPRAVVIFAEASGADFEVFAGVCGRAAENDIPVIFLTDRDDERCEAAAFGLGAADYAVRRSGGDALINRVIRRMAANAGISGEKSAATGSFVSPEELLEGKTILIAEDVVLNQEIISAMLSGIDGLTLDFANNGNEAVEKFRKNAGQYYIVFMDVQMPVMNGLKATKAIRALDMECARTAPIIALTASSEQADIEQCMEAGMNGYLEKPMDYGQFLRVAAEYGAHKDV